MGTFSHGILRNELAEQADSKTSRPKTQIFIHETSISDTFNVTTFKVHKSWKDYWDNIAITNKKKKKYRPLVNGMHQC